jgi:hypothetical protein
LLWIHDDSRWGISQEAAPEANDDETFWNSEGSGKPNC